jgi:SAM-dependent methyltransferase
MTRRRCPVCGSDRVKRLYRPKASPGPVSRCLNCGLTYIAAIEDDHALIENGPVADHLDPAVLTSANLNDLQGCWELALLPSKESEWPAFRVNAEDALDRIERLLPPALASPRRILDFGCGWGFFLGVAKERGWETFGLEPLPGHAVYARATCGATVTTDVLRGDSFPANHFQAITSFQVFEHLPDPLGDLGHLQQMLMPGGIILIEVPNVDTWSVRLLGPRHRHFVQDHLNFFSAQTLSLILEKNGFEVLNTYYPTRRMTIRHLVSDWGRRYLPSLAVNACASVAEKMKLTEKTIGINVGDIIAAIGRKSQ